MSSSISNYLTAFKNTLQDSYKKGAEDVADLGDFASNKRIQFDCTILHSVRRDSLSILNKHFMFIFVLYLWVWSGTKSTITEVIYWLIVPALDDRW
jgi:hypothetical protein